MHSIQPFGHHSDYEVHQVMGQSHHLLAVRPETTSREHALPYVHDIVLAEVRDGSFIVGYILDPRFPIPVQVVNVSHLEGLPNVQLGMVYVPHHEVGHHGGHYEEHHEEHHGGHHGGLLHRLVDNISDEHH